MVLPSKKMHWEQFPNAFPYKNIPLHHITAFNSLKAFTLPLGEICEAAIDFYGA